MKKLLFLSIMFFAFVKPMSAQVCSLDTFTIPGIYPDTLVNLPSGYSTAPYGTVIQVRVFTDTVSSGLNVHVDDIEINSVVGLPTGFTYACFPGNCKFPGGGNGCIYLSGTPAASQIGTHTLVVNVTLHGKILGVVPVSQASQILGYKITILGAPVANFTASANSLCQGETVTYTDLSTNLPTSWNWSFPGGTPSSSTLQNPVITYNTAGTYNATLTATSPAGNNALTKTSYITVNSKPGATISPAGPITICSGASALLNATAGTGFTYQWSKNGVDLVGATGVSYLATSGGSYKVKVTKPSGCYRVSGGKQVSVSNVQATVTPGGGTTFCSGGSVLLSANTGTGLTYQWRKSGVDIAGATGNTYSATSSGTYKVTVTNSSGCTKLSPTGVAVTVNSLPSATFTAGGPLTFCAGGSVTFTANSGNFTYQWKRNGNNINGATQATCIASVAGTYKVTVTNTSGCSKTSSTKTVIINCKDGTPGVPVNNMDALVFPNPSNGNATARFTTHEKGMVQVAVYDQQGKLVLEIKNEIMVAGLHEVPVATPMITGGFYLLKISAPEGNEFIKMMLNRD